VGAALFAFAAATAAVVAAMSPQASRGTHIAWSLATVVSCAASSLALAALLLRFVRRPSPVGASLAANAYGIYALHYPVVSWLQWAALGLALPGLVKMMGVTAVAIALSWALAAAFRRSAFVRRAL
jgi:peptidoglycan/LPS O-acetylase OafA/YrhL